MLLRCFLAFHWIVNEDVEMEQEGGGLACQDVPAVAFDMRKKGVKCLHDVSGNLYQFISESFTWITLDFTKVTKYRIWLIRCPLRLGVHAVVSYNIILCSAWHYLKVITSQYMELVRAKRFVWKMFLKITLLTMNVTELVNLLNTKGHPRYVVCLALLIASIFNQIGVALLK